MSGRLHSRALPAVLAALVLAAGAAGAKEKKPQHFGVISGSVFRETGFSFAGVEIVVTLKAQEEAPGSKKPKLREWKGRSDARGEFAFRVPALAGRYTVAVRAEGYKLREQTVEIGIDERRELIFNLEPVKTP